MHAMQDFVDPAAWDEARDYGDGPCPYIRYNLTCKAVVNKKRATTDTKEDMVLSPVAYGEKYWQGRIRDIEQKGSNEGKSLVMKKIVVKIAVAERGVEYYINEFDAPPDAWSAAAKQLSKWWARYHGTVRAQAMKSMWCPRNPISNPPSSHPKRGTDVSSKTVA